MSPLNHLLSSSWYITHFKGHDSYTVNGSFHISPVWTSLSITSCKLQVQAIDLPFQYFLWRFLQHSKIMSCKIWGSHAKVDEDLSLLRCDARLAGKQLTTFCRSMLPPHSGSSNQKNAKPKNCSSKMCIHIYQSIWCNTTEDIHFLQNYSCFFLVLRNLPIYCYVKLICTHGCECCHFYKHLIFVQNILLYCVCVCVCFGGGGV